MVDIPRHEFESDLLSRGTGGEVFGSSIDMGLQLVDGLVALPSWLVFGPEVRRTIGPGPVPGYIPMNLPTKQHTDANPIACRFEKHRSVTPTDFLLPRGQDGGHAYGRLGPDGRVVQLSADEIVESKDALETYMHGVDLIVDVFGEGDWALISSSALFFNVDSYTRLPGDIDVTTDTTAFFRLALAAGKDGRTKLDQLESDGAIVDVQFTKIDGTPIDLNWIDDETLERYLNHGDIKLSFGIVGPSGLVIDAEIFMEPPGYGLIQLGTDRTKGMINTYQVSGKRVYAVNQELAAMSYLINFAHEIEANSLVGVQEGRKLKDSYRIHNIFYHMRGLGIKTPGDILLFIDKTMDNYHMQVGDDGGMADYLAVGLQRLREVKKVFFDLAVSYEIAKDYSSVRGTEKGISFDALLVSVRDIRQRMRELLSAGMPLPESVLRELVRLQLLVDITDPSSFAYYYELRQLRTNFVDLVLATYGLAGEVITERVLEDW